MALRTTYMNGVLEIVNFVDGGGAIVRVDRSGQCSLYEVPQYGGEEQFHGYFDNVCLALDAAAQWPI
jgi:hypothetical protein